MELRVPGDKSISHRVLVLAALAEGTSRLTRVLPAADTRATARCLRALGAPIPTLPSDGSSLEVRGVGKGGFREPRWVLDCGNSGTTARLLTGVLAAQPLEATLTGDDSLRSRPMGRVVDPLRSMGAEIDYLADRGHLPVRIRGGRLGTFAYDLPVASAQVKSALLLAGLVSDVDVCLSEPARSRDHTERLLARAGAPVVEYWNGSRWSVELRDPPATLRSLDVSVPGDFSSAAFWVALGLLGAGPEEMVVRDVGVNPTRTALLAVLHRMGAALGVEPLPDEGWEPRADLRVRSVNLMATEVVGSEIPGLIDEIPVLAVLASRAAGRTRITGAAELRHKETDRIRALVENLRAVGVDAAELDDGLEIEGTERPLRGRVRAFGDHRIAMAFGVLAAQEGNGFEVDDPTVVDVSYPGFWSDLGMLSRVGRGGASGTTRESAGARKRAGDGREGPVVTIDGPAGSGKSTTAREVARRLGFRHLDSGALYRALTHALLEERIPSERWAELTERELDDLGVEVDPDSPGLEIRMRGRSLGPELRNEAVTAAVSTVASLPAVRRWLLGVQRRTGDRGRLVADGRDMGTVVFPDAEVKVFLVAMLDERARRRMRQEGRGVADERQLREEAARLEERDRQDSSRSLSPLKKPADAVIVDTTDLSFDEQVEAIVRLVKALTPE